MTLPVWLTLLGACGVISFTPGVGAVNTMTNALTSGWRRSIWGVLGQQVALLVHIAVVAAGVGVLVTRSAVLFDGIRYAGAAYLVYLGIRQLLAASASAAPGAADAAGAGALLAGPPGREPALAMVRRGLLVNLTNPKAIVFFLAFIPQFVRPERPLGVQYAVLTATVVAVDVAVMWFFFATAARGLRRLTTHESGRRTLDRVFGLLFIAVGVLLAVVH